jgi:cell division septation protein DedD
VPSTVGGGEEGSVVDVDEVCAEFGDADDADGEVEVEVDAPVVSWEEPPVCVMTSPTTVPTITTPPAAARPIRRRPRRGTEGTAGPGSSPGGMTTAR